VIGAQGLVIGARKSDIVFKGLVVLCSKGLVVCAQEGGIVLKGIGGIVLKG
jgi:hypothetical protein